VSALAFVVVGTAELYTAVGIEHRVDVDAVAVVVAGVVAKGGVAVDIVIAVLVAKELDTVWNGESFRETLSVRHDGSICSLSICFLVLLNYSIHRTFYSIAI